MKLTLDALLVLDAIDRKGSFAAAADEMNRVPSAVTYVVRKLEEDLDVLLFDRSGHRAKLTVAGRELLDQGRQLLTAAGDLECRVKRVATGWETELRIAYDTVVPIESLYPLLARFYAEGHATRIRLQEEVLGGAWEAMKFGRADLVVGASGGVPSSADYKAIPIGEIDMVFAVAPSHPLAKVAEPIALSELQHHRVVAVADSSRNLPPRSFGILDGQDTLTVPTMQAKIAAQIAGLGVGNVFRHQAQCHLNSGALIERTVERPKPVAPLYLLTPKRSDGKALQWWVEALRDPVWWQSWTASAAAAPGR
ncbi:LysR family transcriptional regulator [Permianibacter sp. IMCC34836]|uniref:LysR family transcriptional regulator n=1 Tax=Permianibacter fluminis TaxID=2738515 RepID=UPI001555E95D|nr:LysR family transcriptional regulator [Permianibacter fluminis]NQD38656.1 LysR family transcriptional regulator [Permianibacter fluminis]